MGFLYSNGHDNVFLVFLLLYEKVSMLVIMTGFGSRVQLKTSYFFFSLSLSLSLSSERSMVDKHRTVLVFFIGGCTFAEIASLRFLSQREDGEIVRNDIHVWRYFLYFHYICFD